MEPCGLERARESTSPTTKAKHGCGYTACRCPALTIYSMMPAGTRSWSVPVAATWFTPSMPNLWIGNGCRPASPWCWSGPPVTTCSPPPSTTASWPRRRGPNPKSAGSDFRYHLGMQDTREIPPPSPFRTHDLRLEPIAAKVMARERLSFEDGLVLYGSPDVLAVGWLANH